MSGMTSAGMPPTGGTAGFVECGMSTKKRAGKYPGSGHIGEMAVLFHFSLAIAALILAMAASIFSMLLAKEILIESGSPNARPVTVDTCA
jgi:hypothetical protein